MTKTKVTPRLTLQLSITFDKDDAFDRGAFEALKRRFYPGTSLTDVRDAIEGLFDQHSFAQLVSFSGELSSKCVIEKEEVA